jgi:hypothetical protein
MGLIGHGFVSCRFRWRMILWSISRVLFGSISYVRGYVPEVFYCSGDDTISLIRLKYFLTKFFLDSSHGISFSTPSLSICKDSNRIAIECLL